MSDQGGWSPPDRPTPPPSIHNRPTLPGGGYQPPPSPPYAPPAPPGGGGWEPPPPPYAPPPPPSPPGGGWQPPPPPPPPGGGWQPPPAPSYSYGGPPGGQQTEPLSTWSLVSGILSFVFCPVIGAIVAIVTGVKAKKAIDRSGGAKTGRTAAVVGEILGIVNLALSVLAIVGLVALGAAASKHTQYTDLQTGDCFNRIGSSSIFSGRVDRVDCSQPHDIEVTGSFEAVDPGSFPGTEGFRTQAEPKCSTLANSYLGNGTGTGLNFGWVTPSQSTWDRGTHTVICGIQNADGSRRTGSVKG